MTTFHENTINFDTLATQLTPTKLRKTVLGAFIGALLSPIKSINADYVAFRAAKRQRMSYNGQVRLLENIANIIMIGYYDADDPVIYIDEPDSVNEFLISPSASWEQQSSIHYDDDEKSVWDYYWNDPEEEPEEYSILHNQLSHVVGLGFEVHLTPQLSADAPSSTEKSRFYNRGGCVALANVIDTYKLAGKRYTIIQDPD